MGFFERYFTGKIEGYIDKAKAKIEGKTKKKLDSLLEPQREEVDTELEKQAKKSEIITKSKKERGFIKKWLKRIFVVGLGGAALALLGKKAPGKGIWQSIKESFSSKKTSSLTNIPTQTDLEKLNLVEVAEKTKNTVLIGASHMIGYHRTDILKVAEPLYKGGRTSRAILNHLNDTENIEKIKKSKYAVVEAGVNDIWSGFSVSTTKENLLEIAKRLKTINPNIKVIICTVPPFNKYKPELNKQETIALATQELNSEIVKFPAYNSNVDKVIDIYSFTKAQSPDIQQKILAGDNLHHSLFGRQLYSQVIAASL